MLSTPISNARALYEVARQVRNSIFDISKLGVGLGT